MRTRFSSLRTLFGAVLVAGGLVVACTSQSRHDDTTVAQAGPPLGQSHVSRLPSNISAAPPDAAETPAPPVERALPLSRGAQGLPPTPAPTPASPNAPVSPPAANPIPSTGGAPVTPTAGGSGTGPSGTTPPRAQTDTGSTGSPAGNTPTSTQGPTTDTGAQNGQTGQSMNAFGFEPMQGGVDGGVGPVPIRQPDAGAPPPLLRADGGLPPIGGVLSDGGLR